MAKRGMWTFLAGGLALSAQRDNVVAQEAAMKKIQLDCGCAPWGMCDATRKLTDGLAFEEAGVRVLAKATLAASGMAFAQAEVRLGRQVSKVEALRAALNAHEVL